MASLVKRYDNHSGYHGLYDTALWKRARKAQLNTNPLCFMCTKQGLTTQASIVDHIKPHKGDTSLFYDRENLQSLCKLHHDSSKQKQERTGIEPGADVNGYPVDKNHHWNK
jgi:5-methylcytosine-specific restriction endonuclease McrA